MGLISYIVNYDELIEQLKNFFDKQVLDANLGSLKLDTKSINVDLTEVYNRIDKIISENKTQSEHLSEGVGELVVIKEALQGVLSKTEGSIENLLKKLEQMVDLNTKTNELLQNIDETLGGLSGTPKIIGKKLEITSSVTDIKYEVSIETTKNTFLTAVTLATTSYTDSDSWSLYIGNAEVPVFQDIYVKPNGDRKDLKKKIVVPKNEKIKIVFSNDSTSGKTVFIDFELIEDDTNE